MNLSNVTGSLLFQQEDSNSLDDLLSDYQNALIKISELENELLLNKNALSTSLSEQAMLQQKLKLCIDIMDRTGKQLNHVDAHFKNELQLLQEQIALLESENRALQMSNHAWAKRSLTLEFDRLAAQDRIKSITAAHDVAVDKIYQLEIELNSPKKAKSEL